MRMHGKRQGHTRDKASQTEVAYQHMIWRKRKEDDDEVNLGNCSNKAYRYVNSHNHIIAINVLRNERHIHRLKFMMKCANDDMSDLV
jgi:hypothetical protein